MRIGVKYCGGCNPRYDRQEALEEIKRAVPDAQYVGVMDEGIYDVLLVLGGCPNCCADIEPYSFLSLISVWAPSQVNQAINAIKSIMKIE